LQLSQCRLAEQAVHVPLTANSIQRGRFCGDKVRLS